MCLAGGSVKTTTGATSPGAGGAGPRGRGARGGVDAHGDALGWTQRPQPSLPGS